MARPTRAKWQELELVCEIGVGIAAIAPSVCRLLRELVGADAAALFWMDERGLPEGFFHEDSTAEAQDLFANEFERLFLGPAELNVAALVTAEGPGWGRLLVPPASYWRSNTFNLLVRASGHHHSLDLRVEHGGRARAVALLFRVAGNPFGEPDLATLRRAAPALSRAFERATADGGWEPAGDRPGRGGTLIVDAAGERLLFAGEGARLVLQTSNLVGQGIPADGPLRAPPAFARRLCAELAAGGTAREVIPVARGRLVVTAEPLAEPGGVGGVVALAVALEVPGRLRLVEHLMALDLSPRRRSLLFAAASGETRAAAAARTRTSPEAMKKHLAAIYDATGLRSWSDLGRFFGEA